MGCRGSRPCRSLRPLSVNVPFTCRSAGLRQAEKRFPPQGSGPSAFQLAPCPDTIRWCHPIETKEKENDHIHPHSPRRLRNQRRAEKTSFRRVGAVFENTKSETGETFLSIKLDFPVGVTELVAFQPKPKGNEEGIEQD